MFLQSANEIDCEKYPEFVLAYEDGPYSYGHIVDTDKYIDANDMLEQCVNLWGNCMIGYSCIDDENGVPQMGSLESIDAFAKYDGTGVKTFVEISREDRATKYMQGMPLRAFYAGIQVAANEEFPAVVYFDVETSEFLNDTKVALKEYSMTETAKFITGERDLAELPDYFDEMDALGAQEYIQIHQDYFDAVVAG